MSIFANLKDTTQADDIKQEVDSVGGGGLLESGLYVFKVAMAYAMKSKGGANGLVLHLDTEDGKSVRETLWVTSGDAKGNLPYYVNAKGEKHFLPGFNLANSLCLLTVGEELADIESEEKLVNVYSPEAGKEVPTKVQVLMPLLGQEIIGAVLKQIEDKNVKADDGSYVPSGETRETNVLDKFFRAADKLTTAEIRAGVEEAGFYDTWDKKNTGQVRDRSTKGANGSAGAPKTNGAASPFGGAANTGTPAAQKPTKSLFG